MRTEAKALPTTNSFQAELSSRLEAVEQTLLQLDQLSQLSGALPLPASWSTLENTGKVELLKLVCSKLLPEFSQQDLSSLTEGLISQIKFSQNLISGSKRVDQHPFAIDKLAEDHYVLTELAFANLNQGNQAALENLQSVIAEAIAELNLAPKDLVLPEPELVAHDNINIEYTESLSDQLAASDVEVSPPAALSNASRKHRFTNLVYKLRDFCRGLRSRCNKLSRLVPKVLINLKDSLLNIAGGWYQTFAARFSSREVGNFVKGCAFSALAIIAPNSLLRACAVALAVRSFWRVFFPRPFDERSSRELFRQQSGSFDFLSLNRGGAFGFRRSKFKIPAKLDISSPRLKAALWTQEVSIFDGNNPISLKAYLKAKGEDQLIREFYRVEENVSKQSDQANSVSIDIIPGALLNLPLPALCLVNNLVFFDRQGQPLNEQVSTIERCVFGGFEVQAPKGAVRVSYSVYDKCEDINTAASTAGVAPLGVSSAALTKLKTIMPVTACELKISNPQLRNMLNIISSEVEDFYLKVVLEQQAFAEAGLTYLDSSRMARFYRKHKELLPSLVANARIGLCDTFVYLYCCYKNLQADVACLRSCGFTYNFYENSFGEELHGTNQVVWIGDDTWTCEIDLTTAAQKTFEKLEIDFKGYFTQHRKKTDNPIQLASSLSSGLNALLQQHSKHLLYKPVVAEYAHSAIANLSYRGLLTDSLVDMRSAPVSDVLLKQVLSEFTSYAPRYSCLLGQEELDRLIPNRLTSQGLQDFMPAKALLHGAWEFLTDKQRGVLLEAVLDKFPRELLVHSEDGESEPGAPKLVRTDPLPVEYIELKELIEEKLLELSEEQFVQVGRYYYATFYCLSADRILAGPLDASAVKIGAVSRTPTLVPEAVLDRYICLAEQYLADRFVYFVPLIDQYTHLYIRQDFGGELDQAQQKAYDRLVEFVEEVSEQVNLNSLVLEAHLNTDDGALFAYSMDSSAMREEVLLKLQDLCQSFDLQGLQRLAAFTAILAKHGIHYSDEDQAVAKTALRELSAHYDLGDGTPNNLSSSVRSRFIRYFANFYGLNLSDIYDQIATFPQLDWLRAERKQSCLLVESHEIVVDISNSPIDLAALIKIPEGIRGGGQLPLAIPLAEKIVSEDQSPTNRVLATGIGPLTLSANDHVTMLARKYLFRRYIEQLSPDQAYKAFLLYSFLSGNPYFKLNQNELYRYFVHNNSSPSIDLLQEEFCTKFVTDVSDQSFQAACLALLLQVKFKYPVENPLLVEDRAQRRKLVLPVLELNSQASGQLVLSGKNHRSYQPIINELRCILIEAWDRCQNVSLKTFKLRTKSAEQIGYELFGNRIPIQSRQFDELRKTEVNELVPVNSVNWKATARNERLVANVTKSSKRNSSLLFMMAADELLPHTKLLNPDDSKLTGKPIPKHGFTTMINYMQHALKRGVRVDLQVYFRGYDFKISFASFKEADKFFRNPDQELINLLAEADYLMRYESQIYAKGCKLSVPVHPDLQAEQEIADKYTSVILNESGEGRARYQIVARRLKKRGVAVSFI